MIEQPTKKDKFVLKLIDELADDGERAIMYAYALRDFKNRTYNLHDSYVSAVFVDGVLYNRTVRYVGNSLVNLASKSKEIGDYQGERTWEFKNEIKSIDGDRRYLKGDTVYAVGRREAKRFLLDYGKHIRGKMGIQLVIGAAMFYTPILEGGKGRLRYKFRVISSALPYLRGLRKKYGGTIYNIDAKRNEGMVSSGSFSIQSVTPII